MYFSRVHSVQTDSHSFPFSSHVFTDSILVFSVICHEIKMDFVFLFTNICGQNTKNIVIQKEYFDLKTHQEYDFI